MKHLTIQRIFVYLVIIVLAALAYQHFMSLPVARLAFVEPSLQKGPPSLFSMVLSKAFDNRRELIGNDKYRVYAFAGDSKGLRSVSLSHNGTSIPFQIDPGSTRAEKEFDGNSETGVHKYVLTVANQEGVSSMTRLIVNVRMPVGPVAF